VKQSTTALLAVVVVGTLCVLTCGGVAACLGLVAHWQEKAVLEDPAAVTAAGDAIVELHLPKGMTPLSGMQMDVPFTDRPLVTMAMYEGEDPLRYLMLFAIRRDAVADTSALRSEIEQTVETAIGSTTKDLVLDREWTDSVSVHGTPVEFRFRRSTNAAKTVEVTEATAMLDGTFGPATVVFVTVGTFDADGFRAIFK
jgi:hypothetical protein